MTVTEIAGILLMCFAFFMAGANWEGSPSSIRLKTWIRARLGIR